MSASFNKACIIIIIIIIIITFALYVEQNSGIYSHKKKMQMWMQLEHAFDLY